MMIILNWRERDLIFFVAWNSTLHVPLFNSECVCVWFAFNAVQLFQSVRRHLEGRSDNGGCCIPFCKTVGCAYENEFALE